MSVAWLVCWCRDECVGAVMSVAWLVCWGGDECVGVVMSVLGQ